MWAKLGRWVHFGAWMDVDVALAVRIGGESVWVVFFVHLHHDSRSINSGSSRLDRHPERLVHESKDLSLPGLLRENVRLERDRVVSSSNTILEDLGDVVENFSRKKIDSTVDVVGDEAGRLLDVVDDFVRLRIHSHATVVHALLIFNLNTHDEVLHPLFAEGNHVGEDAAEVAENITEDKEEGFCARSEDKISEEVNASCCSEERIFLEISNVEFVLVLHFSDETVELLSWLEESDKEDLLDCFDRSAALDVMLDKRKTCDWEEGLWEVEGKRAESSSLSGTADENHSFANHRFFSLKVLPEKIACKKTGFTISCTIF